jgi:TRAP-type C4-dicarboxylate transport system permease small subunit
MGKFSRYFFGSVNKLAEIIAGLAFIVLCLSVATQVVARYLFNYSFSWSEEFPVFLFLWVSFVAAAAAYRDESHLSVTFVYKKFPRRIKKILLYVNLILSLMFFIVVGYSELMIDFSLRGSTFVVMKISKLYCYIGIPMACLLFIIFGFEKIYREIKGESSVTEVSE